MSIIGKSTEARKESLYERVTNYLAYFGERRNVPVHPDDYNDLISREYVEACLAIKLYPLGSRPD